MKIDTINLQLAADVNTRQQMFEQGQIDIFEQANAEYLEKRSADIESGKLKSRSCKSIIYVYFV